ncbi:MFS transporter [Chromohalobacter japonicus]|uniref:MFS transporter n=1 Tax=Chromohalobacter japonicus TaxID=223900 RepID=A0A1Q8TBS2_9GAMM|nr:MFS transporter [Chromohalobacter japonicus]OLO11112.1 MFS transporter [Chromohalobacter japonicus]
MFSLLLLSGAMFALGLDAYVLAGLLPGIATSFNVTEGAAAQTVTAFTLCYAVAAPALATALAGQPIRRILILAMSLFVLGNLLSVTVGNFTLLLISRCIAGAGAGIFAPVAAAVASNLVAKERKGRALGLILGGMGTGTVVGVPIGIQIANAYGWQSTLLLVALIGSITVIGILTKLPAIQVAPPPSLRARVNMLIHPRVAAIVTVTLFTAIASLGLYTYIATLLTGMGLGSDPSMYLWVWGIGGVTAAFSVGHIIDRTSRPDLVLLIILTILAIALFCLPLTGSGPTLLSFIPFLLWGAMGWSSLAPQQHVLLDLQPEHGSIAVALNSSANYLGSAIGAILGGLLLDNGLLVPTTLPIAAGCTAVAAAFLQVTLLNTQLKNKSP